MAKTKAEDPRVVALAEGLLSALERLRGQGHAYPPTLRQLAEAAGARADTDADLILRAAASKPFTQKVVATDQVNRKPTLESSLYFKGDKAAEKVVKAREIEPLARRLALVLESLRPLGAGSYPVTVGRLAELAELKPSDKRLKPSTEHEAFTGRALIAVKNKAKHPFSESVALLRADADLASPQVTSVVIERALDASKTRDTEAFTTKKLASKLPRDLKGAFPKAVIRCIERGAIPPGIGWVKAGKNEYLLFFLDDVHPSRPSRAPDAGEALRPAPAPLPAPSLSSPAPAPAARPESADFAPAFRAAFQRLDRENRSTNFVRLLDLRRALPQFDRASFDAGLRQLRIDDVFTLNSHDGRHDPLTDEERQAGINEAGSWLVYVSRKD